MKGVKLNDKKIKENPIVKFLESELLSIKKTIEKNLKSNENEGINDQAANPKTDT